jgi:hypothetical protein
VLCAVYLVDRPFTNALQRVVKKSPAFLRFLLMLLGDVSAVGPNDRAAVEAEALCRFRGCDDLLEPVSARIDRTEGAAEKNSAIGIPVRGSRFEVRIENDEAPRPRVDSSFEIRNSNFELRTSNFTSPLSPEMPIFAI